MASNNLLSGIAPVRDLEFKVRTAPGRPWGDYSLTLSLPAVNLGFSGLSSNQHAALVASYPRFIQGVPQAGGNNIDCRVLRLNRGPNLSLTDLTVDGQYALKKSPVDDASGFRVTGVNFEAELRMEKSNSSLGVVHEHELAQPGVIENYLRVVSAHNVLSKKGVLLHSAGVVFEEKAYIFCGRSNAGKTTLTRKAHAHGARVLSDDINLLLPAGDDVHYAAHAVPFTGEFGRTLEHAGANESYPVAGIVLLEHSNHLEAMPVTPSKAVARLWTCCPFVNNDEAQYETLFSSVLSVVSKVPVMRLLSRKDDDIDRILLQVKRCF